MTPPARRVLMTTDAVGGVWVYATALARALCQPGTDVTLVVMGPPPAPDQLRPLRGIDGLHIEVTDLALEWMDPEGANVTAASDRLLRLADRIRPDLVHLNSFREASFDWPAPVVVVAHSCVLSWWQACRGHMPADDRWRRYAAGVSAGLAEADAWIAPTAAARSMIEANYRPPAAGHVIWNGLDIPSPDAPKRPFILCAGRLWDEAKNLASLATMAPQLDWPIKLAGPLQGPTGSARQTEHEAMESLGVLPRSALLKVMQQASIFAAPAIYEPFGLTVLEAAASGCALVLSEIPSLQELWDGCALFIDPRDRKALHATLQRLATDTGLRSHMQAAALHRSRRYSLSAMVSNYAELYRTLVPPVPLNAGALSEAREPYA